MNEILPSANAKILCLELFSSLSAKGFDSAVLNGKNIGVLIAEDKTVYNAFSGSLNGSYIIPGFVNPCFNVSDFDEITAKYKEKITEDSSFSIKCWEEIKSLYSFNCFDGVNRSLTEIFPSAPSGTGDCCAPKLLNACYKDGRKPFEMAELFIKDINKGLYSFSTPCDFRCKPLLSHILGLDIIYQDSNFVVVNKPHGILAIEGKGADKQDCIASRVRNLFHTIDQPCIHRLDMATSGLMILAKNKEAHRLLSKAFEERTVYKEYRATVCGILTKQSGTVVLKQRLNLQKRPLQIIDNINGKEAVTMFTRIGVNAGKNTTDVLLVPKTGRTHQLRLAMSYLGHPILNDPLYGSCESSALPLALTATKLCFTNPFTGAEMSFSLE